MISFPRQVLVCLLLVLWGAAAAEAQTMTGVDGTVLTPEGDGMTGVLVAIEQLGLSAMTDVDGHFSLPAVGPGSYELLATLGRVVLLRRRVEVVSGETLTVTLRLPDLPRGLATTVTVRARADSMLEVARTASEGVVGQIDLQTRPLLRSGDLVETVPGVIATQHSGGGKANQYFLRGFNLDHGTDFAARVDSVPINLPTHGHGQGYLDLNFLIPEAVESIGFTKGFVSARSGDFTAAGAADFMLRDRVDRSIISFAGGEYGYARALALGSTAIGEGDLLGAIEFQHDDGPWDVPGNFRKLNALLRYSHGGPAAGYRITGLGYRGWWDSTDQIPRRAVESGALSRFGSLDNTTGGESGRYSLSGEWWRADAQSFVRLAGYAVRYDLELYSNFTYVLEDPRRGDQFEQRDDRWIAGSELRYERDARWAGIDVVTDFGLQLRQDWIDNGLFRTADRRRHSDVRSDSISVTAVAPFAAGTLYWTPWLRSTVGLRADFFSARVDSDDPRNSGDASQALASPKLTAALGPWADTEIYGSFGGGFHSNDARGTTITIDPATGLPAEQVPLLVRGWGWEGGVRTEALPGLQTSLTVFALDLDSELVFVGDRGGTEAGRPSRRRGVEWTNFYTARPWLRFDLDLAFTRARFDDGDPANRIPGAIEKVISGGVALDGLDGWSGAVRVRYFGDFALTEDDSVRADPSTQVNARLAHVFPFGLEIGFEVFNLFSAEANDIQYFYTSRLPGEPARGIDDVHFHPVPPRTFRFLASWRR